MFTRRTILQASVAGFPVLSAVAASGTGARQRAKSCIFIFAWGGPAQLDTFDMKPEAPAEVRGEFKSIATPVPGLQICEHFQQMASRMDRVAVVRSLTHTDPAHLSSAHATLTGHLAPVLNSDAEPPSERDWPHLGSVLSHLGESRRYGFQHSHRLPSFVALPWKAFHPAAPGGNAPGQHGGWLGRRYDPFLLTGDPNAADWSIPALTLVDGVSPARLQARRQLLDGIRSQQEQLARSSAGRRLDAHQDKAIGFLSSKRVRAAFDLRQESDETRERYGRNTHGQCALLARRLVEHGVSMVNVNWHNDGKNFWDTHGNNFARLKNDLIPPADAALAALLDDLADRGLLKETLVCWVGEFGRKPQIRNGGREHWPNCYCGLLAGGGIRGGAIYGESDKHAAYPHADAVSPQDYAATVMQALGIPETAKINDRTGRPHPVFGGSPLTGLFG